MVEFTISGECIGEIDQKSSELQQAEKLSESELFEVFEDVLEVKEVLEQMTGDSGSVRRKRIEEEVDANVSQALQLLQAYGYAASGGKGGNWKYTEE